MARATITIPSETPDAQVLTSQAYGAFIVLRIGDVSMYLEGYNAHAALDARSLAATLLKAADMVEAQLAPTEAV